jgi:hypothetical protein
MRLEGGCYCGAVRYVAEGEPGLKSAMPLPRLSAYLRWRTESVHAHARRGIRLHQRRADNLHAARQDRRRNAGILRAMRYTFDHAATRPAAGGSEDRNAGQSFRLCRRTNGHLHRGRPAFSSHCSRRARLRRVAATPIIQIDSPPAESGHHVSVKAVNARFY